MKKTLQTLLLTLCLIGCITNKSTREIYIEKCNKTASKFIPLADPLDWWQTPSETERSGSADCEDRSFWLEDKLKQKGIESRVVFGKIHKNVIWPKHAWVEYTDEKGEVWVLDPSYNLKKRKSEISKDRYQEFGVDFNEKGFGELLERKKAEYKKSLKLEHPKIFSN